MQEMILGAQPEGCLFLVHVPDTRISSEDFGLTGTKQRFPKMSKNSEFCKNRHQRNSSPGQQAPWRLQWTPPGWSVNGRSASEHMELKTLQARPTCGTGL